jgi:hypothetical protein
MRRCAVFSGIVLCSGSQAFADKIIYTCGPSSGCSYYLPGGLAQDSGDLGWKKDGIQAGLRLIFTDSHELDLVSMGDAPNDFSYSSHGCQINSLQSDNTGLQLMVRCPSESELFMFSFKPDKTGELVRAGVASSQLSKRAGVLHSECRIGP